MKNIIFIIVLLLTTNIQADDIDFYIKQYDQEIAKSKYSNAVEALLKAQAISPYNEQITSRMKIFKKIIELKNETSGSLHISTPSYVKKYEQQMKFNQKFYNPSTSDIVLGFLATATVFVGAKYVENWSEAQSNSDNKLKSSSTENNSYTNSSSSDNTKLYRNKSNSYCSYKINRIKNTDSPRKSKGKQIKCSNGEYVTVAKYYKQGKWKKESDIVAPREFDTFDEVAQYACGCN